MRNILLIGLVGLVFCSFLCPKKNKNDFKIISAQKQTVYGGVAGSPVVTTYRVKLKALQSFNCKCDSSFAEGKIDRVFIQLDSFNTTESKSIKKGEIVEFICSLSTESQMGGGDFQMVFPGSIERKPPVLMEKGILLAYYKNKEAIKYLKIENILQLSPIYAP